MSKKSESARSAREARAERAAVALRERERAERRRSMLMIGGVVLVMVLIVAAGFLISRARDTTTDIAAPAAGAGDYGVAIGDASAPKTVVIYEDFLCPFCAELEAATQTQLSTLADEGKVYVEYRPFHLLAPDYSAQAASAFKVVLDAAGPEVAKKFHDELYADQPDESGPYPDADWLVEKAVAAGAAESEVRVGIEQESQKSWVDDVTAAADEAGVGGTPTVLVDGKAFTDYRTIDDLATNLLASLS